MKVYAIRHKPSGECMPARMSARSKGGWSAWIPGPDTPSGWASARGVLNEPRIFFSLQSARNALTAWLQGVWRTEYTEHGWECPETDATLIPEAPPVPRVREDMEIVPLLLAGPGLSSKRITQGRVLGMIVDIGRTDTSLLEQQLELARRVESAHCIEQPND